MTPSKNPLPALTAIAAALAISATAHAATPVGSPVSITTGDVADHDFAQASDGRFAVVWLDSFRQTVRLRRFGADGVALDAAPIVVAARADSNGLYINPHVAINAVGESIVSWDEYIRGPRSTTSPFPDTGILIFNDRRASAVHARGYRADGTPRGDTLTLVDYPDRNDFLTELFSDVAIDADGDFSLTWLNSRATPQIGTYLPILFAAEQSLMARRFHADGSPIGLPALLAASTLIGPIIGTVIAYPSIASDAAGNTTVAWGQGILGSAYGSTIFRRTLSANGLLSGPPLPVAVDLSQHLLDQAHTSIAMAANGRYTIAWDGCVPGICARNFLPGGLAAGLQYTVSDDVPLASNSLGSGPHVAIDASGRAVFGFRRANARDGFLRVFDARGTAAGPSIAVGFVGTDDVQVGSEAGNNFTASYQTVSVTNTGAISDFVTQRYQRP